MKPTLLILLAITFSFAQRESLISLPSGYSLKTEVVGDLTGDGIDDIARVINTYATDTEEEIRIIQVYEGSSTGYHLIIDNDKALWKSDGGGQLGDPLTHIEVKRGSLYIHYYGGSGWRWEKRFQFLSRGGIISLVGIESESYHLSTSEKKTISVNYLSGKTLTRERIYNFETKSLDPWIEQWETQGRQPLIPLSDFNIDNDRQ